MSLEGNISGSVLRGRINPLNTLTMSAYAIAVKNGFKGTEEEWLASLKGDPGIGVMEDRITGKKYTLYVSNGKLIMDEVGV